MTITFAIGLFGFGYILGLTYDIWLAFMIEEYKRISHRKDKGK